MTPDTQLVRAPGLTIELGDADDVRIRRGDQRLDSTPHALPILHAFSQPRTIGAVFAEISGGQQHFVDPLRRDRLQPVVRHVDPNARPVHGLARHAVPGHPPRVPRKARGGHRPLPSPDDFDPTSHWAHALFPAFDHFELAKDETVDLEYSYDRGTTLVRVFRE